MGVIAAYAMILVVGATGNACVVYAVWRHRSLRTVRNVFIVGLSCSDLLSAVSSVLVTPIIALVSSIRLLHPRRSDEGGRGCR